MGALSKPGIYRYVWNAQRLVFVVPACLPTEIRHKTMMCRVLYSDWPDMPIGENEFYRESHADTNSTEITEEEAAKYVLGCGK